MPKLFEQSDNNDPDLSRRIAFGGSGVNTENMSFTNFLTWIYGKLGFCKTSNNLSDLASSTTARSNLSVYSISQVDGLLNVRALVYPATNGALKTTNTTSFYPTSNHHPATKRYVDGYKNDAGTSYRNGHIISGTYHYGDISSAAAGDTITITHNLGSANYRPFANVYTPNAAAGDKDFAGFRVLSINANDFTLKMHQTSGTVQDIYILWMILLTSDV